MKRHINQRKAAVPKKGGTAAFLRSRIAGKSVVLVDRQERVV